VKSPAIVVAVLAVTIAVAAPAVAVQTDTFGLQASGSRTKMLHPPGGSPVHDSVVVYNRTTSPVTVDLDVISETLRPDGTFTPGASGAGLAADVQLAIRQVTLGARARRTIGVTINRPDHATVARYAAVTAVAAGAAPSGGVGVQERLAVLVGITADGRHPSGGSDSGGARVAATIAAALLLAIGGAALVARRRGGLHFGHASRP
jgi:hypothetical protein